MRTFCKYVVGFLVLVTCIATAQVSTGTPPFGSFGGGPFDRANLGNFNVHFAIPVLHKAGRGLPFNYDIAYDNSVWTPKKNGTVTQWTPVFNWGWSGSSAIQTGYLEYTDNIVDCWYTVGRVRYEGTEHETTGGYVYHDAWGGKHAFAGSTSYWTVYAVTSQCPAGKNSGGFTATATDGSGYTITVGPNGGGSITTRDGNVINPPYNAGIGSASATDSNGNKITINSSGQFFDTLSSTTPVLTVSSAAPPTPTTFTYPAPPNGASNVSVTMNYQQYTVQTAFGISGIKEYGPLSNPLVSSVQLPDGSSYAFTYEAGPSGCTPINGAPCTTGRIKKITLPSGGTITYNYTGTNSGIESDGSGSGFTRTLNPGGEWQYSRTLVSGTPGAGSTWQTTVIDPNSNQTVINFSEDANTSQATYNLYETQRQVYQGSSTLLATGIRCYNGNYSSCSTAPVTSPIKQIDSYTQLPNGKTRLSEVTYDPTYGMLTSDKEYDYGVTLGSAPSSNYLVSNQSIAYYAPSNGIASMVQTVTVKDGSGNTKSSTSYTFDGTSVTTTTGTPQHVSVSGARGNLTTMSQQVGNGTTLYRKFTYYDTGMPNNSTGVSTSSTATCANTPSICTTYNYSSAVATCGNSFPTSVSTPMNLSGSTTWNCVGAVSTQTKDANQNPTNYTYGDPNYWRVTSTSSPDGGSTSTTYNFGTNSPWNIVTSTAKDSTTNVTGKSVLDGLGRVVQTQATSDPSGNTDYVDTVYDAVGRIASVSNPYQTTNDPTYGITQYSYDSLNRTTSLTHADNTQMTFNYSGAATQVIDEGNNSGSTHVQRVYQSDGLGRLTSVCEVSGTSQLGSSNTPVACGQDVAATGFLTTYGHDTLGNLSSVTQGSLTRSYSYDYLSRLTQEVNPESGTTTYSYDTGTGGDLYQRTRPKPNQTGSSTVATTYTHDNLHRLIGISYNDGSTPSVTLSFDQSSASGQTLSNYLGKLTSATAANGAASTIFSYDKMGHVAEDWQCTPINCGSSSFSLSFSYDYLGDLLSLTNSEEGVTYTYSYDTLARLTKLQSSLSDSNHPGTLLTVNTYNPLGEVTKATLGNGIVRTVAYDMRGRATSRTDGTVYSFSIGYAADGNILTGNDSINGNWTYTYDDFNRIASANKNNGQQTYSYAYDRYSNRWQQNSNPTYIFNNNNQIQGSGVVYDAAGNITNDGLGNTYTYDAENRVISVSGSNSSSYVYDAFGKRVRSTINSTPYDFIYNGSAAIDEVTSGGWQWGDAASSRLALYANGTTYFNHSDWLGSIRAWSNISGSSVGTCINLPFGDGQNCTGRSPNSWHYTGYTGLPSDSESGLTHALFRQLSTTQGRWISPDPAGTAAIDPTNPQSWNRYTYALNGPLNSVDPSGLSIYDCIWNGGCNGPCNAYCSWSGGGGGGGGGGGYGASYVSPGIFFTGPLWAIEGANENRYSTILSTGCDPVTGSCGSTKYFFTGGDGSVLEQQRELAAIQFGQQACAGQDAAAVASCIQQVYDQLLAQGTPPMQGGNYDFSYANQNGNPIIQVNGQFVNPSDFGCSFSRCGVFDSLDYSHGDGTFHVDTGNPMFFPVGSLVHFGWDIIGGNTVWSAGGIPRPWW